MHTQNLPFFFFLVVSKMFSTSNIQIKTVSVKMCMWSGMTKEVER